MNVKILLFLLLSQGLVSCGQESKINVPPSDDKGFKTLSASLKDTEMDATRTSDLFFSIPSTGPFDQKPLKEALIIRSTDGGQTWQDAGAGLRQGAEIACLFPCDDMAYLGDESGLFLSEKSGKSPFWRKDFSLGDRVEGIYPGLNGIYVLSYSHGFLQQMPGAGIWSPVFAEMKNKMVRCMLETPDGAVLVGCDNGIFKSSDHGVHWKQVFDQGIALNLVESDGVIIGGGQRGIFRSIDGGEHWDWVLSEGGVGIATECIKGGFAAITYNTESETRRVRISTDGGVNWQEIDANLPPSMFIASIKQVGEYFFCGHPNGIYRSADRGKTWNLMLPAVNDKVFNLSVSGNVIYAVARKGGC